MEYNLRNRKDINYYLLDNIGRNMSESESEQSVDFVDVHDSQHVDSAQGGRRPGRAAPGPGGTRTTTPVS